MSRRIVLSLAIAIAALLLGLVLAQILKKDAPKPEEPGERDKSELFAKNHTDSQS